MSDYDPGESKEYLGTRNVVDFPRFFQNPVNKSS